MKVKCDILLADDDDVFRQFVREILAGRFTNVVEARDGLEAQQILFSQNIDLVLCDVRMPGMTGAELYQRSMFAKLKSRWIIMTGFHTPELVDYCLKRGVSRYLRKPFRLHELLAVVDEVLGEKETDALDLTPEVPAGWLELQMESSEAAFLKAASYFGHYFQDKVPEVDIPNVRQAFEEMLRNAMEWGNKMQPGKKVKVGAMLTETDAVFRIEDEGMGFNVEKHTGEIKDPLELQNQREKEGKRPGGFGIFLSRRLMDSFFYNEKGNCVIMTKRFGRQVTAG